MIIRGKLMNSVKTSSVTNSSVQISHDVKKYPNRGSVVRKQCRSRSNLIPFNTVAETKLNAIASPDLRAPPHRLECSGNRLADNEN
jgi:hypothetical protein